VAIITFLFMATCFIYCRRSLEDKNRQVLSLDDQEKVCRQVAVEKGFTILDIYRESKSAKRPDKRPEFSEMVERIRQHEATYIICWKADRLCRNAKEGGMLIDKVDYEGMQIITSTMDYDRNTSTFLFIEFGMATKFSKDLSDNVKRGLQTKLQMGWSPCRAPLGYTNNPTKCKGLRDITPDPLRFHLCRKWWELLLTGEETIPSSLRKITALGLTNKRSSCPVSKSEAFRFFRNIFYTGLFDYKGERFAGKHPPMITMDEYTRVQAIIDGRKKIQNQKNHYYFMRLFTCGECGAAITAERHTKRYRNGKTQTFVYGRCTKKKGRCSQLYVNAKALETQLLAFVASLEIRPSFVAWLREVLKRRHQDELTVERIQKGARTKRLDEIFLEKKKLYGMKDDGLVGEEEYQKDKKRLLEEEQRLKEEDRHQGLSFQDTVEEVLAFASNLTKIFYVGSPEIRRMVLRILGSNLIIQGKKACIDAKNAFIFLKQIEKEVTEQKHWLEPRDSLNTQSNPAFLYTQSDRVRVSVLCSNLYEYITPELTLQIKMLKEHIQKGQAHVSGQNRVLFPFRV
jgi:site-specific DNA recombinase